MTDQPSGATSEDVRAAFRDLHGARLHGFALLLTLGDRAEAAAVAAEALAAATERVEELRHPERAAAWLRRRVVDRAAGVRASRSGAAEGDGVLAGLGADWPMVDALAVLGRLERAAIIASTIERLDRRDVATIVGRDGDALDRLVRRARGRYVDAYTAPEAGTHGPIVSHIHDVARQALA